MIMYPILPLILSLAITAVDAGEVVQIDVRSVLDGRSVTTLSPVAHGQVIVTWDSPLGFGATGACGYITASAWKHVNTAGKSGNPLPDDGVFEAAGVLPRVVLNYSNADGVGKQTRTIYGSGAFSFEVPRQTYSQMYLFFSAAPALWTDIVVTVVYQDGSEYIQASKVPEFSARVSRPVVDDKRWSVLASDIGKWDAKNECREKGKHYIDALAVDVDPTKTLVSIKVESRPPTQVRLDPKWGVKESFLTFWGATGMTAKVR